MPTERVERERQQAFLDTLLEHTPAGVLAETHGRTIPSVNQAFCRIFAVPTPPPALIGASSSTAIDACKRCMLDPDAFVRRIEDIVR